jgi:hypothetical protein
MNLEVFKEVVRLLKEHEEKVKAAHESGVDLINFCDPISTAVGHMIGGLYGKEGKETFDWWCYEKDWGTRKDLGMRNSDGVLICDTIEDLHQWLEDMVVWDYELPKKLTEEEQMKRWDQFFNEEF